MSTLLTQIAISDGKIKRSSLEVLSHCKALADQNSHKAEAVIIDSNASDYVDQVKKYGASKIYVIEDPVFKNHINTPLLKALVKVMEVADPHVFAFASTEGTKDILGALSANQGAAVLSDVSEFDLIDAVLKSDADIQVLSSGSVVDVLVVIGFERKAFGHREHFLADAIVVGKSQMIRDRIYFLYRVEVGCFEVVGVVKRAILSLMNLFRFIV